MSAKFSVDGKFVAVCDMAGNINVYELKTKELYWSYELGSDVETLDWHHGCNVLFAGTCDGNFCMFKISTNEIKYMFNGDDQSKVNCFKILNDGKRAACAYSNGLFLVWDLKTQEILFKDKSELNSELLCMDLSHDGNLVAYGGTNMKMHVMNTNNGKIINTFDCNLNETKKNEDENEEEKTNSIETIGFSKIAPLLACATLNGEIYIWDLKTSNLRNKSINEYSMSGFIKLMWNNDYKLYISSLNSKIYQFDGRNLTLENTYEGHTAEILDFCLSDDFKYLATASDDHKTKIFKLF